MPTFLSTENCANLPLLTDQLHILDVDDSVGKFQKHFEYIPVLIDIPVDIRMAVHSPSMGLLMARRLAAWQPSVAARHGNGGQRLVDLLVW